MYSLLSYIKIVYYISFSPFYIFYFYYFIEGGFGLGRRENEREISGFKEDWGFRIYKSEERTFGDLRLFWTYFRNFWDFFDSF